MTILSKLGFTREGMRAILRVTGEDTATFLQGQFTNELRGKTAGEAVYGLWLNQKGKVVADSFVISGETAAEFYVVSYFCEAEGLRRRLEDYIIADDVVVEDLTADWTGISLTGPGARAWAAQSRRAGWVFPGRRVRSETIEWVFPRNVWPEVQGQLAGLVERDAAELARLRIEAGIPAVPADIGSGDLPGEGALEAEAISYTKGCYLGQEVMARLKSMGQVRRTLRRVAGVGVTPAVPAALWQGGRQVGELRSVAPVGGGFVGLAMLSLINFQRDQALTLGGEAAAVLTVEIVES